MQHDDYIGEAKSKNTIKYDIIPILKSPNIGDFNRYGLKYLPIKDFLENKFPTNEEKKKMCKNNKEIILNILEEYRHGRDRVIEIINESCNINNLARLPVINLLLSSTTSFAERFSFSAAIM